MLGFVQISFAAILRFSLNQTNVKRASIRIHTYIHQVSDPLLESRWSGLVFHSFLAVATVVHSARIPPPSSCDNEKPCKSNVDCCSGKCVTESFGNRKSATLETKESTLDSTTRSLKCLTAGMTCFRNHDCCADIRCLYTPEHLHLPFSPGTCVHR